SFSFIPSPRSSFPAPRVHALRRARGAANTTVEVRENPRVSPSWLPSYAARRLREDVTENPDDLVHLRLGRDEGRRDLHDGVTAVVRTADQARLEEGRREESAEERLALRVVERRLRLAVLDELERVEEPRPAHVADDVDVEEGLELRAEETLRLAHVLDDAFALHDLDVLERHRALHGMTAERDPVRVHRRALEERLCDTIGRDHRSDRGVRGGQPLRRRDQVGPDVVALRREPGADPPEARDHLVGGEQDVV